MKTLPLESTPSNRSQRESEHTHDQECNGRSATPPAQEEEHPEPSQTRAPESPRSADAGFPSLQRRWYLRIVGLLTILGVLLYSYLSHSFSGALLGERSFVIALGVVIVITSFGVRVSLLMSAFVAFIWWAFTLLASTNTAISSELSLILLTLSDTALILWASRSRKADRASPR